MKAISVHVPQSAYQEMKSLAARRGRPVAELIRQALEEYLSKETGRGGSLLDVDPHASGKLLEDWDRSELLDEMLAR